MSLNCCLEELKKGFSFVNKVVELANTNFNGDEEKNVKEFIIESAFLKMFIFWEEFIENSIVIYISNDHLETYVSPVDNDHASSILIGTQKYVDWANYEVVKKLANLYLKDGEPYKTTINSISTVLSELKIIRNSTAHKSSSTSRSLKSLIRKKFNTNRDHEQGVSTFLMTSVPEKNGKTLLETYQEELLIAAECIAPRDT